MSKAPRNEAGVPLGGIGAGKIELCADGRITNVTTNNNLDSPITDGLARMPLFPRVKEGAEGSVLENAIRRQSVNAPEGLPGAWAAVHTAEVGARLLKTVGRPAFSPIAAADIAFTGRFPVAQMDFSGLGALTLELEAFSPFDLADPAADHAGSALPLAVFVYTLTNAGDAPLPVALSFSWQNLNGVGGYPMTLINTPDPTSPVFRADRDGPGLVFGHDPQSSADPRVLGEHCLRGWSSRADATFSATAWQPTGEGREIWAALSTGAALDGDMTGGTAGVLSARLTLAPGETGKIVFALAWFMPSLLAAETKWDNLVRPSSAPPAPTTPDRRDYGHRYALLHDGAWSVAGHGLAHWQTLRARVESWQGALDASDLPPGVVTGLCNDLCALVSNTWYTRDGHYAVNEAPTDMNGCFGTIDQRSVGCAAVALAFPALNRGELSLFGADQIRAEGDPRRHGLHWNAAGGNFDLPLDRAGAILHDIGWDHLEGGRTGDAVWSSAHWPEHSSHFVLQGFQYAQWSGDAAWLDAQYPRFKAALEFQMRLDQDGDGVPDLWGSGSNTYDTEMYPYYGAAAYTTGLLLAALRVMQRLARERGDDKFAAWAEARFATAQAVMEHELWDEQRGYYVCWRDTRHADWKGARAHGPRSTASHVSQLAGCLWADMLGLGDIVQPERRRRALDFIARHNVAAVPGCAADEYRLDGQAMQSMAALAMGNFAANAVAAGLPDAGWEAMRRIYHARYEHDGCPWDAPLQWSGPGNLQPQWGRWYMSHPASWFVLWALGGARIDRLAGTLEVSPSWPSAWGEHLTAMPVFLPGLQAEVDAQRTPGLWSVTFRVLWAREDVALHGVSTRLPHGFDGAGWRVEVENLRGAASVSGHGRIEVSGGFVATQGAAFTIRANAPGGPP